MKNINQDLLSTFNHAPDDALVKIATVQLVWGGIAKCTVWRYRAKAIIPNPVVQAPGGTNFWRVGDLRAALKQMGGHS
ncbi:transcriptional regulator [Hydromonas duriensis]|uniref:AlpA family transcriptional regulator n=1 Tax=Hydromonas duriensis TaxID=1527608 RepID=A0A4R6Y6T4_9BURK|nr:transcriptional regulator [Hydromonas duriensis]TDR31058.1 hypothetical protein DFR44_1139 [Hydromonas duriensis]